MNYKNIEVKKPIESKDYQECSEFITDKMIEILEKIIDEGSNKIVINTSLKLGLPMENINKIAGPFVEAWAVEKFSEISNNTDNPYQLVNVEAKERLYKADIILQFEKKRKRQSGLTAEVDVKATSEDIKNSGKSPNITSFARIRTAYIKEPDYFFIVLSLKHSVYSKRNENTTLMDGIMEVVDFNVYDLKFLSSSDINYNPALGTGQIQIADIHYVSKTQRTTWEFCELLDDKFMNSSKKDFNDWLGLAKKYKWIKEDG